MKRLFLITSMIVIVTITLTSAWKAWQSKQLLYLVPPDMAVSKILYVSTKASGLGPGGNEAGIILFEMPRLTREMIKREGISWLSGLSGSGKSWYGQYPKWHETPFDPSVPKATDIWTMEGCGHEGGIAGYMFRYGVCIPLDHKIEETVNEALSSPNNFYAFGRIGMLVLIPDSDLIVYAYNG